MISRTYAVLLLCLSTAVISVFGYGVENNAGLRQAKWTSPTSIEALLGPGFGDHKLETKAVIFQIVSEQDKRFRYGVAAASVRVLKTEPDGTYPNGWRGPRFDRYSLRIALPAGKSINPSHRYWLRINSAWVMAKNCRTVWIESQGAKSKQDLLPRYGIREAYVLGPNILHIITGPGVDLQRLVEPGCVTVQSPDDPQFRKATAPAKIGRRSNLDFYIPRGWPWKLQQRHELFLVLPGKLQEGKTYKVNLNAVPSRPVTCGASIATIRNDSRKMLNLGIKVNQYGYLLDAQKYGYLGMWMGDIGAADFASIKHIEVRDSATHKVVLKRKPELRHRAGQKTETVYKQDLSYEDTWQLDLSALRKGRYYAAIPGMGRSFGFRVSRNIYVKPTRIAMNGVLHQRSGIELKAPYATPGVYRPASHRNNTEYGTMGSDRRHSKDLVKFATDGKKYDLYGGHHDAGDWNPRSRLDYAEYLFLLYDMNPRAFCDKQFNRPESGNGIPDLLDEAWWSLDLWNRLQAKDGGVHSKVETNGDPLDGDVAETDRLREFAFRKEPGASYRFAANSAWASIFWRRLKRKKDSDKMLRRAVRAWDWAEVNLPKFSGFKGSSNGRCVDQSTFAAAMLLRATSDRRYDTAFRKHSVLAKDARQSVEKYGKHDQILGSYIYAKLPDGLGDAKLKRAIVSAFEREFDQWKEAAETTNYRYMRSPYAPNTWGTGGLPAWVRRPAMVWDLTKDPARKAAARQWILYTNDFSLGCHPMNLVFTVGLGQRYVTGAWHILMEASPAPIIPGLHSNGAGGRGIPGMKAAKGGMGSWPNMALYPTGKESWPDLYRYSDDASPGQNEGCWPHRMVFAYGLFLPPVDKRK